MTGLVERVTEAIKNARMTSPYWDDNARDVLRAILETHAIVPKEPDDAMVLAGDNWAATTRQTYKAMLAAAPDPLKD
jgi:DNA-binding ferritin-like protein